MVKNDYLYRMEYKTGVVFYIFVGLLFMSYVWLVSSISTYILIITASLYIYLCLLFYSVLIIKKDTVVIYRPFFIFNRIIEVEWCHISKVKYIVMTTKATNEQVVVHLKEGTKYTVYLSVLTKRLQPLRYIQSKGVVVEVFGTENNSIDDLRH